MGSGGGRAPAFAAATAGVTIAALSVPAILPGSIGRDFRAILWAPTRGLVQGLDPYAGAPGYLNAFQVDVAATLHAPWLVALAFPLAALNAPVAFRLWFGLSILGTWVASWLAVRPTTWGRAAAMVTLGTLMTLSAYGDATLRLGQVTWLPVLGVALIARRPTAWAPTIGVLLLTVNPPFAVVISILLVGMGMRGEVIRGWLIAAVTSLPVLAWACWNAGGIVPLATSVIAGFGDAVSTENRIDLVAGLAGSSNTGQVVTLLVTVVAAALLRRRNVVMSDHVLLAMCAWSVLMAYAQPYNVLVVLLLAIPVAIEDRGGRRVLVASLGVVCGLSSPLAVKLGRAVADPMWVTRVWYVNTFWVDVVLMLALATGLVMRPAVAPRGVDHPERVRGVEANVVLDPATGVDSRHLLSPRRAP